MGWTRQEVLIETSWYLGIVKSKRYKVPDSKEKPKKTKIKKHENTCNVYVIIKVN